LIDALFSVVAPDRVSVLAAAIVTKPPSRAAALLITPAPMSLSVPPLKVNVPRRSCRPA